MPELPEVETTVRDLNKRVIGLKITGVWTDWSKLFKEPKGVKKAAEILKGRKILGARRRAKYIFLDLSGNKTLIIHQKISGHLLYGRWKPAAGSWQAAIAGPLKDDPQNRFIRLIFFLSNGRMLALSDLRRFGKALILDTDKIYEFKEFKELGPEPLDKLFTFEKFREIIKRKKGKIKQILMNQNVIAGIGNIYSDEILWYAGIHPLRQTADLKDSELKSIYKSIKKVLPIGIKARGDSMQDYRTISGELGSYQYKQKTYQLTGKKCSKKDGGIIKRIRVNNRSAHFCPLHQK